MQLCDKHPKYMAKREPRTDCERCKQAFFNERLFKQSIHIAKLASTYNHYDFRYDNKMVTYLTLSENINLLFVALKKRFPKRPRDANITYWIKKWDNKFAKYPDNPLICFANDLEYYSDRWCYERYRVMVHAWKIISKDLKKGFIK
jgi:hypothetical protein